ncbi:uncharacterized protein LODBEIA_P24010 [Lodderomyces beijingensis]|uniref:Nitrogen permease regulator 2 n=1 Tax=Lodderomyces beijingensis TaxID=1775926 RepID=A0ABP0ZPR6_9ASCO
MSDGFIPIISIFYAVFHPEEGTKIVHQFPENLIASTSSTTSTTTTAAPAYENEHSDNNCNSDNSDEEDEGGGGGGRRGGLEDGESEAEEQKSLFNFDIVKNYVIPKPQLCNRLISFKIDKWKVLGFPVHMVNEKYARNSFSFNFCFVFPYDDGDTKPYESAIKRMGQMFQVLEEQSFMLSRLDKDNSFSKTKNSEERPLLPVNGNSGSSLADLNLGANNHHQHHHRLSLDEIYGSELRAPGQSRTKQISLSSIESLITQIYQDLNNYSECCIPLDSSNSVDIKLFPILPAPVNIKAYQVPLPNVKLQPLVDVNWDPTMIKILPFIDGINSVKRISELCEANYIVTKQCIQQFMHYDCIEIIDIFQFSNIYAPTNLVGDFLKYDGSMAESCQAYVVTNDEAADLRSGSIAPSIAPTPSTNSPRPVTESSSSPNHYFRNLTSSSTSPYSRSSYLSKSPKNSTMHNVTVKVPTKSDLFSLYRSLNQGQTVKEWCIHNNALLRNVDVRRFINFGILRGIIYRVYSYPILHAITRVIESGEVPKPEDFYNNTLKRKKPEIKTPVNKSRDEGLLKSSVHEQTLTTDSRRRVSFTSSADRHRPRLHVVKDVISEDDSEESDEDEISSTHRVQLAARSARTSSSSRKDSESQKEQQEAVSEKDEEDMIFLIKMLIGFQHFDSICTELQKSRGEVEKMIEKLGSYSVINC